MSEELNKNLGHATAYGYAKANGYNGTEAEFGALMASYGQVAETATQAATEAHQSMTAAGQSASNAADSASDAADSASEAASAAGSAVAAEVAELQAELVGPIPGATVDSEVINARVDSEGTTYSTLKERLDTEHNDLKNQLLQHQASIEDIILTKVLTEEQKNAILACFRNVAWINDQGQTYYKALQDAFDVSVTSISAVYTQSGTVFDTQTLDDLRQNLVVTATMSDGTTSAVKGYALSGSLTAGTSTITVTYAEKTTTFNVTVTHMQGSIVSISAVMDSSATITTNDSLEDLRQYLTVTAHYDSGDDVVVTGYTLSGSLNVGQNTITVTYSNKTTTFTVTVIEAPHITAVFDASGNTIYTDDALDSLKQYLTVTYHNNGTQVVLDDNDYTLSGSLTAGTSTITVSYSDLVTTVNVTGVVDFYNISEWSDSNGLMIKYGNIVTEYTTSIVSNDSGTNRGIAYCYRGKKDIYKHNSGNPVSFDPKIYPIPAPVGAVRVTMTYTGSFLANLNLFKYNDGIDTYTYNGQINYTERVNGTVSGELDIQEGNYFIVPLFITGTSGTLPTSVNLTFYFD